MLDLVAFGFCNSYFIVIYRIPLSNWFYILLICSIMQTNQMLGLFYQLFNCTGILTDRLIDFSASLIMFSTACLWTLNATGWKMPLLIRSAFASGCHVICQQDNAKPHISSVTQTQQNQGGALVTAHVFPIIRNTVEKKFKKSVKQWQTLCSLTKYFHSVFLL